MAVASPDQAADSVRISKICYNSPGTDTRSNASLNTEWMQTTNSATQAVNLKGWALYTLGAYPLDAGRTVTVHTGKGTDTAYHRYQGRSAYVWNNDKDTAALRRAGGTVQDTCPYKSTRSAYKVC
ncbi:lamin tail domain-containing protein [Streptomyces sp. NPDC001380]|uniref:lamin tail domain-containing protein n=1 Tax=Streptomyces sp. NPDC001380 TaxID=3364566 RepID=UPI0036974A43